MSDDLRTRIAQALQGSADDGFSVEDWLYLADAVIAELRLEVEDGECNYCHAMLPRCRYSTWKADDE